jgi:hypothetical protein
LTDTGGVEAVSAYLALAAEASDAAAHHPWDISTLFQDSAGTAAVTGPGDPVGRIQDVLGSGHHLVQEVSAARPECRTADYAHICADGVDDWLKATDAFSPGGTFVAVLAVKSDDAATSFSGLYADGASGPGQIRGISSSRWAVNAGSGLQPSL